MWWVIMVPILVRYMHNCAGVITLLIMSILKFEDMKLNLRLGLSVAIGNIYNYTWQCKCTGQESSHLTIIDQLEKQKLALLYKFVLHL